MKLLNKLTLSNLKLNKKRTIVTIVGIMLSVALITAVATIYSSGLQSLIDYETHEKGLFHVAFFDVPLEDAEALENNRAVDTINLVTNIGYAEIDSKNEYKPYVYVKGFTEKSLENLSVKLISGRLPENDSEILIPSHLKSNGGVEIEIGETITLEVGKRMTSDGVELDQDYLYTPADEYNGEDPIQERITDTVSRTYTVVGIMERPAGNIESYSAPGYTLITYADENTLSGKVDAYIHFTKSEIKNVYKICAGLMGLDADLFIKAYVDYGDLTPEETVELATQALNAKFYDFQLNEYLIILESDPANISGVSTLSYAVYVVIAIIVLTSIFCIKNSFDISISEKIRQYGMLRSIGATRSQIRKNVFFEATILGVFGIPLGILLGFLASYILVIVSNMLVSDMFGDNFSLAFTFSWKAVLAAVILGIVTVYFSAFRSALKASRVTPLDSIRNSARITINPKKLRVPKIIRKMFGMGGEISYKNLKRNKKKYRTTVISIAVSVTIFIALSAFMSMAFYVTDLELQRSDYNINISASYSDAEEYQKLADTTHFDYVQESSILRDASFVFTGDHYNKEYTDWIRYTPYYDEDHTYYMTVTAVGTDQFAKYCRSLGLDPEYMKDKAILCDYDTVYNGNEDGFGSLKEMRIYDFKKGDAIIGTIENYNSGEHKDVNIEIGAVTDQKPFGLKLWGGSYLFISDELFDRIADTRWVRICYKTDNSEKLQEQIEAYLGDNDTYDIYNNDENYRQLNNVFTLIGIFLYGFIIVISLIGITNIFNTITTNMELRKPEFAMLRSVGMTNNEFGRMIRLESLFMGLKALIFGIPIGVALAYLIYHFLAKETGTPFRVPWTAILIAIAAVLVLIFLIMTYSMSKIRKQNTIETIRNENI